MQAFASQIPVSVHVEARHGADPFTLPRTGADIDVLVVAAVLLVLLGVALTAIASRIGVVHA